MDCVMYRLCPKPLNCFGCPFTSGCGYADYRASSSKLWDSFLRGPAQLSAPILAFLQISAAPGPLHLLFPLHVFIYVIPSSDLGSGATFAGELPRPSTTVTFKATLSPTTETFLHPRGLYFDALILTSLCLPRMSTDGVRCIPSPSTPNSCRMKEGPAWVGPLQPLLASLAHTGCRGVSGCFPQALLAHTGRQGVVAGGYLWKWPPLGSAIRMVPAFSHLQRISKGIALNHSLKCPLKQGRLIAAHSHSWRF